MRCLVVGLTIASIGFGVFGGSAQAAKPAVRACFGATVSAEAQERGAGFGQQAAAEAHEFGGLGELVQAFQAGEVPDEVEANACNDGA